MTAPDVVYVSEPQFDVEIVGQEIIVEIAPTIAIGRGGPAFVFTQDSPSVLWSIEHGLHSFAGVTVVDTLGRVVEADVVYVDIDHVTVGFSNPATGQAFLS